MKREYFQRPCSIEDSAGMSLAAQILLGALTAGWRSFYIYSLVSRVERATGRRAGWIAFHPGARSSGRWVS